MNKIYLKKKLFSYFYENNNILKFKIIIIFNY